MTRGGKRPGAGRKKGSKSAATLEREATLKHFRERTMRAADILFNSQLSLARGLAFLYKIEKYWEGTGRHRVLRQKKPQLVTDQWEIEAYLEGQLEEGDLDDREATYYFITTKEPDNKAIDSLLDRALGKSVQLLELPPDADTGVVVGFTFKRNEKDPAGNPAHS